MSIFSNCNKTHRTTITVLHDALGSITMGDLAKERLIDIWRGEKYMKLRKSLIETRQTIDLYAKCDNFGLAKRDEAVGVYKIEQNWKK